MADLFCEMIQLVAQASGQTIEIKRLTHGGHGDMLIELAQPVDSGAVRKVFGEMQARTQVAVKLSPSASHPEATDQIRFPGNGGEVTETYVSELRRLVAEQTELSCGAAPPTDAAALPGSGDSKKGIDPTTIPGEGVGGDDRRMVRKLMVKVNANKDRSLFTITAGQQAADCTDVERLKRTFDDDGILTSDIKDGAFTVNTSDIEASTILSDEGKHGLKAQLTAATLRIRTRMGAVAESAAHSTHNVGDGARPGELDTDSVKGIGPKPITTHHEAERYLDRLRNDGGLSMSSDTENSIREAWARRDQARQASQTGHDRS